MVNDGVPLPVIQKLFGHYVGDLVKQRTEGRLGGVDSRRWRVGFGVGERGAEEAVGPLFGERSGLAEDDRHRRVADGEGGEQFGGEAGLT
jgi:hypothetical protein